MVPAPASWSRKHSVRTSFGFGRWRCGRHWRSAPTRGTRRPSVRRTQPAAGASRRTLRQTSAWPAAPGAACPGAARSPAARGPQRWAPCGPSRRCPAVLSRPPPRRGPWSSVSPRPGPRPGARPEAKPQQHPRWGPRKGPRRAPRSLRRDTQQMRRLPSPARAARPTRGPCCSASCTTPRAPGGSGRPAGRSRHPLRCPRPASAACLRPGPCRTRRSAPRQPPKLWAWPGVQRTPWPACRLEVRRLRAAPRSRPRPARPAAVLGRVAWRRPWLRPLASFRSWKELGAAVLQPAAGGRRLGSSLRPRSPTG
mmetsp:Transcript_107011/g.345282  ORF Transcript_107011/g.345282 Transcript_107011/m.345282 type:complete len:310 (-) Transcript_107011:62-991(-)